MFTSKTAIGYQRLQLCICLDYALQLLIDISGGKQSQFYSSLSGESRKLKIGEQYAKS